MLTAKRIKHKTLRYSRQPERDHPNTEKQIVIIIIIIIVSFINTVIQIAYKLSVVVTVEIWTSFDLHGQFNMILQSLNFFCVEKGTISSLNYLL